MLAKRLPIIVTMVAVCFAETYCELRISKSVDGIPMENINKALDNSEEASRDNHETSNDGDYEALNYRSRKASDNEAPDEVPNEGIYETSDDDIRQDPVRWALLVAGSKGWRNYDDQANLCHAYNILKTRGVNEDNIVTMMFDDIAEDTMNPKKGTLINGPGRNDVYDEVKNKIDYKEKDVNAENFLKVLGGDLPDVGTNRVISSDPNNMVFVYFTGQGVPGGLVFPDSILYANVLIDALENMFDEKKFAKMVFYVDAPYSGSVFEQLPKDKNILAVTAAAPWQTAYKCYKDAKLKASVGSHFSINWMHDTESRRDLTQGRFLHQINHVAKVTTTSIVSKYGDLKVQELPLSDFMGDKRVETKPFAACKTFL